MIVVDSGVLYAGADQDDDDHAAAAELLDGHPGPLVVPVPVVVETSWLIERRLGPAAEHRFLQATAGELERVDLDDTDWGRVIQLIGRYADLGLGLVDASVVAVAERLGVFEVATLDHPQDIGRPWATTMPNSEAGTLVCVSECTTARTTSPRVRAVHDGNHASRRSHLCHTHAHASTQVRPINYDARSCRSRFLQVDPVEGGSANDYDYAEGDPVNSFDLDGTRSCKWNHPSDCGKAVKNGVKRAAKKAWKYRDEIAFGAMLVGGTVITGGAGAALFYSGFALATASTANSCARGQRPSCAVGAASLATAGAGRALTRAGRVMGAASRTRLAASRWHPIQRGISGPLLRAGGRAASRAGFASTWGSNVLSGIGLFL